jgi:hypothetical protein
MLVSLICAAIREGIESRLKTRAAYLERGIRELLHDRNGKGLARSLYQHPLIYSLYSAPYQPGSTAMRPKVFERGNGLPSYIPAKNFADALMDIAVRGPDPMVSSDPHAPVLNTENIRANITNIGSDPVQRVLLTAIDAARGNLDAARDNIANWFDSSMDRVSGWYKRSTQWIIFWIGLCVAVALNINVITIADFLYRDDTAREAIVARAEVAAADSSVLDSNYQQTRAALDSLDLPMGWSAGWGAPDPGARFTAWNGIFGPILGWLLTAFAATMGAPFWFDVLNRMMVIRSTVKPREKSPEEGSEDRQPKASRKAETPPVIAIPELAPPAAREPDSERGVPVHAAALTDACDVPITHYTRDEDLPPSEGGVA